MIQSEHTLIWQWRRIDLSSLQAIPVWERDLASKDCSSYTHAKWRGRTNQHDKPRAGDGHAPTSRIEARVLGRNIADDGIFDKSIIIKSNQARSDIGTMVSRNGGLWHASYIRVQSLCIYCCKSWPATLGSIVRMIEWSSVEMTNTRHKTRKN